MSRSRWSLVGRSYKFVHRKFAQLGKRENRYQARFSTDYCINLFTHLCLRSVGFSMITGFLVNPDLTRRKIEFQLEHANQFLGDATEDRLAVAYQEHGSHYAALFNAAAKAEGAEPNPIASLPRHTADARHPSFLQDQSRAIPGAVI